MKTNISHLFVKNCLVLSRQTRVSCKSLQNPVYLTIPTVSLSSTVCGRKVEKRPILRSKLYPTHLLQHRWQHFDPDKTTISFVDNLKFRHLSAGIFKTLSNMVKFYYMQIFYDKGLKLDEFVLGAKGGISFVSTCLGGNDTVSLKETVTGETLLTAEKSVKELDEEKQSLLVFNTEDIIYFNILDIGIIEDGIKRQVLCDSLSAYVKL